MRENSPVGIALCGIGNVGSETARLLISRRAELSRRLGRPLELRWVISRRAAQAAKRLRLPKSVKIAKSAAGALADPKVQVLVELFGGLDVPRRLVLDAFKAGKHVVTANKHLVSVRFNELHAAAEKAGRALAFEAAVAGGIPIIGALREGLAANKIHGILGIFNGTTNYILSEMGHSGLEFGAALKEAQRLGMAERDPTMDLNGTDTAQKVAVLGSLLSGDWVNPDAIPRKGIEKISAEDIRFGVERLNASVKLLGALSFRNGALEAHVGPCFVPMSHPLAAVSGGYNAVLVQASAAEDLLFYGKGAGPGPTASAIIGDILGVARGVPPEPARVSGRRARLLPESVAAYYLKLHVANIPGALSQIAGQLAKQGVSIAQIHQELGTGSEVPVMILTHPTSRENLNRALQAALTLKTARASHCVLRFISPSSGR